MRDKYLWQMKQMKMHEAQKRAIQDPEYQDLVQQIKELTDKRDTKLHELTKRYYEEMKQES